MNLQDYTKRTAELLAARYPPWSPTVRGLDLTEETGELARIVLLTEGAKLPPPADTRAAIAEALCGVLVDVFALAEHYRIDLDSSYTDILTRLQPTPAQDSRPSDAAATERRRP